MTIQEIQQRVTSALWSRTVRDEIHRRQIVYASQELLAMAAAQEGFEHRRALYALLAENLPEVSDMARRQMAQEQARLAWFCTAQPGDVYLLEAEDGPDGEPPEQILCASWADVPALAEQYRAHFLIRGDKLRWRVTKRRILTRDDAEALPGDMAWCTLDDELQALSLQWWLPSRAERGGFPADCLIDEAPRYPLCIPAWSYVKYSWQGWEEYGLLWLTGFEEAMESAAAVIPLDADHMADRDESGRWGHIHVSLADVEAIAAEKLPAGLLAQAEVYRAWLVAASQRLKQEEV